MLSHFASNIYHRSAIDKPSADLLRESEEHFVDQITETALPVATEWFGHWAVRDQMQDALSDKIQHPARRNTYFMGDYQDQHIRPTRRPQSNVISNKFGRCEF